MIEMEATPPAQVSIEAKKAEAFRRFALICINEEIPRQFVANGIITRYDPSGIPHQLNNEELARIKAFEQKHNALVYMVSSFLLEGGDPINAFFFIGDDKSKWWEGAWLAVDRVHVWFDSTSPDLSGLGFLNYCITPTKGIKAFSIDFKGRLIFCER